MLRYVERLEGRDGLHSLLGIDENRELCPARELEWRRGLSLLGLEVRRAISVLMEPQEKWRLSSLLEPVRWRGLGPPLEA